MRILRVSTEGLKPYGDSLTPLCAELRAAQRILVDAPTTELLELFDQLGQKLLAHPAARQIEGLSFLCSWLRRSNLERVVALNLNGDPQLLDGFVPLDKEGKDLLTAAPCGLVAAWLAGNVPTLPMFTLVPALLAKNVCLLKLAQPEAEPVTTMVQAIAEAGAGTSETIDLLSAFALVWFDYQNDDLNREMSLAADAKVLWGGSEAVRALSGLPKQEHCHEIVFGPKYSVGFIDRQCLENTAALNKSITAFVRDIAVFDQRACSSPQTIFIERNGAVSLRDVGALFAAQLNKLPPKPELDAFTTMQIINARADWALREDRDVIASTDGANWTVCLDRELRLKPAVQSRTVFLTEVDAWQDIIPLLNPKVQTVGIAFVEPSAAQQFARAAALQGVARCVRPGLMNLHESPWDGKLLIHQLVRWVSLKP